MFIASTRWSRDLLCDLGDLHVTCQYMNMVTMPRSFGNGSVHTRQSRHYRWTNTYRRREVRATVALFGAARSVINLPSCSAAISGVLWRTAKKLRRCRGAAPPPDDIHQC